VIAKKLKHVFSWGTWPFQKVLLEELGPFLKENSLLPMEVAFFTKVFLLLHGEFA